MAQYTGRAIRIGSARQFGRFVTHVSGMAWNGTTLFMTDANGPLLTLNRTTGVASPANRSGSFIFNGEAREITDLVWDGNRLLTVGGFSGYFFELDPTTSVLTRIGTEIITGVGSLAYDGSTIFAAHNFLTTINKNTGVQTRIGNADAFGVGEGLMFGLEWDGEKLVGVGTASDAFYEINRTTGVATRIGSISDFGTRENNPQALAWDGNKMFMVGNAVLALFEMEQSTPPPTVPPKTTLSSVVTTDTTAVLTFVKPDGPVTDYDYTIDGGTTWISINSTDITYTITGLTPSTSYMFAVRAVNDVGDGSSSDVITMSTEATTIIPPTPVVPSTPTNGLTNFRDLVIDRVENLLVWGGDRPSDISMESINKGLLKQDLASARKNNRALPDGSIPAVSPNEGRFTPIWNVFRRPISPQVIAATNEVPCIFIYLMQGQRPTTEARSVSDIVEVMFVGIDVVLSNEHGALIDRNEPYDRENNPSKPLTDQVNGIITDLDVLLKPQQLIQVDLGDPRITIYDAKIGPWTVGISDDIEKISSEYEIVRVLLELYLYYPTDITIEGDL